MQVNRMPLDGLWRCLCPSVHAVALTHPQYSLSALRKLHVRTRISSKKPSHRSFHNSTRCLENDVQKIIPSPAKNNLKPTKGIIKKLYKYLWDLRFEEGRYEQILKTVDYLVMAMGEKPSLTHYDALIWANADPRRGSVEVVRNLLKEMEDAKIGADSGLYHTVLKVLTIHPDYALRIQILHEMKERWLSLTPDGLHDLIVGLLRDREFEVAKDKLEYMHAQEIRVEPWLYDIFTYQLCEIDELDEALKLLQYRAECGKTVTPYIWYYLFDTFTSSFHYEGTRYIWDMKVKPGHLNPSDGMCTNILNTVARHPGGDAQLATSALRILSNRKTNISTHHYEALISAYLKSSDMKTAFRILNIMERAGHTLSNSNTRPFYLHLSQGNRFCNEAWDVLITLHSEGRSIPTAAVNVVIESTASCGDFDLALDRYKQLHQVCDGGPNTDTFNALFQPLKNLDNKNSKAVAMFLVSEMKALRVKPSSLTYDRLILVCLGEDDYEDAFRYLEEMDVVGKSLTINEEVENQEDGTKTKEQGWWMRPGTAAAFVNKCANAGDLRAWELLKNMEERGMATFKLTEIVKSKIGSKERIGLRPGPKTNLHWG